MYDANDLCRRAMLAAVMAKHHGLSEVSEALLQAARRLPRHVVTLPRLIAGIRSDC